MSMISPRPAALGLLASLTLVALLAAPAWAQDKDKDAGNATGEPPTDYEGLPVDIVGRSERTRIPIAIPDTTGGALAKEVAEVLRFDLQIAGYFNVLPTDSFFFNTATDGMTASTINFQNWFNVGAAAVIKSSVQGGNLDLRLFMVDRGEQVKLNWSPKSVDAKSVRKETHEFVNAILEYYTGTRGPFGTPIAYAARTRAGQKHVYVMDTDGANTFRVSEAGDINVLPGWGAGGVYYTSYRDGNPNLYLSGGGKGSKLISDRPGINSSAAYCGGKLVATLSQGGTNADLYLLDPGSGAILSRLTDHWAIDTSPTFSPDCSQIAFESDRAGGPQIYVMSAGGGGVRRLTHAGKYNSTPSWSPKGDKIAFTGLDEGGASDIFTVDLGGHIERLTQNQGRNEEPSFSPDGNYVVFVSNRGGGGSRLYIMTADGESQTLITKNGSGYSTPRWGGR